MIIKQIKLPYNFIPRHYQLPIYYDFFVRKKKRFIDIVHRRSGKTVNNLHFMLVAALSRVGNYWYIMPQINQCKKVIWNGINKEGRPYLSCIPNDVVIGKPNNSEMLYKLTNGSTIQFVGAENVDSLMSGNPMGVVLDEYSLQNPRCWELIRPILAENGGWARFTYTPRGSNHGLDLYETNLDNDEWCVNLYTSDDTFRDDGTPVITRAIIDAEIRSGMMPELVAQEFGCSFSAAIPGAYYKNEMEIALKENRIREFDIESNLPVYTSWDLGISDSTAIWFFQPWEYEIRIIHYYENHNVGMGHYIEYVKQFAIKHNINYRYHFVPHDANQKEISTGKTRKEFAATHGLQMRNIPNLKIVEGIQAVRSLFKKFVFKKSGCKFGLKCLQDYHKEYNDKLKIYLDNPCHNWSSHCADSVRYFAVGWLDQFKELDSMHQFDIDTYHP